MRLRRRKPQPETTEAMIARLIRDGFLQFSLTEKAAQLLNTDPRTMDTYTYWVSALHAREADAIIRGTDPVQAAFGGRIAVTGDAMEVDIALSQSMLSGAIPGTRPEDSIR